MNTEYMDKEATRATRATRATPFLQARANKEVRYGVYPFFPLLLHPSLFLSALHDDDSRVQRQAPRYKLTAVFHEWFE